MSIVCLIIGLGNLGEKYRLTRHNAGFIAIDQFREQFIKNGSDFSEWKFNKKFNAEISKGEVENKKIILAKPQTFMNNSGAAVQAMMNFYKIKIKNILIIHDDIDLPLKTSKIQRNKSSAGHKGVQSIIDALNSKNFSRLRIGINPAIENGVSKLKIPTEKFALERFKKGELGIIKQLVGQTDILKFL
ncbi:aminoacyl-tRNA hydrolase [Candidatus Parcubacteria bacterium]|nr:aminoacyl-tRNA hydrolase [Candidatus Parcubacteria bacterium]